MKKVFLNVPQNSEENICGGLSFARKLQAGGLQPHEILNLVQALSCEFSEIFIRISILQTSARTRR